MRELSDFFARMSDDPLTMAFEEEKKTMPPMAGMRREPSPWNGGTFAEFAPQAFMAGQQRPLAEKGFQCEIYGAPVEGNRRYG